MNRKMIMPFLLLVCVPMSMSFAATAQFLQTGQTECYYDQGSVRGCAGTGQDGEIKAGVLFPADASQRFVRQSNCVIDILTGLMWVGTFNGVFPANDRLSRNDADTFVSNLVYCGYSDWRLPRVE